MTHRTLLAATLVLVGCAAPEPSEVTEPIRQAEALPLQIAYQGLCNAETLAAAGDMWGAANAFQSQSHAYLHELADRLSASHREAAARLLEAKEVVEVQLNAPDSADPALTSAALSTLKAALADGAELEGFDRPVCGGSPS